MFSAFPANDGRIARRSSILVVGSINVDLVLKVSRLPQAGENLIGQSYRRVSGGKGANQAVAAARLGAQVTLVGKLGADEDAALLLRNLKTEGVNTEFLASDDRLQTGLAVITVDAQGQNSIVVFPGANMEIDKAGLQAAFAAGPYDAVLLQLETSADAVIETCNLARRSGIYVVLDAGPAQEFPLEALGPIGVITPNESEALALTGIRIKSLSDADSAATILLHRSKASAAVLKLGADGAFLKCAEGPCEHFPAHAINAVDSTAAGDAFTAALAVTYIETRDMQAAVRAGNTAGALAAMEYGAQPSLPTAAAIAAFHPNQSVRKHAL